MRLIYLSPVPWCSITQRPHEFVDYFRKVVGGEVLWVDPYPTRLLRLTDFTRSVGNNGEDYRSEPEWLTVFRPRAFPLEPIPGVAACNGLLWRTVVQQASRFAQGEQTALVIGKPSALALTLLNSIDVVWSLYDAMDDFPAFYSGLSRWSMARYEKIIVQRVSRLVASSTTLLHKFAVQSRDAILVLNACRSDLPAPKDKDRAASRPLIGYVGTLGAWFDWELLSRLARNRPEYDFRVIGPMFSGPKQELPTNVELLPFLESSAALAAMRNFDAGLIPFKMNRLTASVDPIKYYEYRAMGLPVISSAFGEMALRGEEEGVFLLGEEADYNSVFDKVFRCQSDEDLVLRFREQNSWEKRFASAGLFA